MYSQVMKCMYQERNEKLHSIKPIKIYFNTIKINMYKKHMLTCYIGQWLKSLDTGQDR